MACPAMSPPMTGRREALIATRRFPRFSGPGIHMITLGDIAGDGSISDVFVKDSTGASFGDYSTDGNSIFLETTVEDVLAAVGAGRDLPITIQWAQVPAPAVLPLLGLAAFVPRRRRRA